MNTADDQNAPRRVAVFAALAAAMCAMATGYSLVELPASGPAAGALPQDSLLIRINTADSPTLQLLPGIGPALADRIIAARTTRPFADADDLERVPGIGPRTIDKLRPHAK